MKSLRVLAYVVLMLGAVTMAYAQEAAVTIAATTEAMVEDVATTSAAEIK